MISCCYFIEPAIFSIFPTNEPITQFPPPRCNVKLLFSFFVLLPLLPFSSEPDQHTFFQIFTSSEAIMCLLHRRSCRLLKLYSLQVPHFDLTLWPHPFPNQTHFPTYLCRRHASEFSCFPGKSILSTVCDTRTFLWALICCPMDEIKKEPIPG